MCSLTCAWKSSQEVNEVLQVLVWVSEVAMSWRIRKVAYPLCSSCHMQSKDLSGDMESVGLEEGFDCLRDWVMTAGIESVCEG